MLFDFRKLSAGFRLAAAGTLIAASVAHAQAPASKLAGFPWANTSLSPDERADLVLKQLTLDEKISLLHGTGQPGFGPPSPISHESNGGAGYVAGIPRLGIPGIQMADAAYGVTRSGTNGRYSTALPSNLGAAASWDSEAAYQYGALIARELRAQGYNMTLGGGTNLAREPRNGRTFEYLGEDPILAGTLDGQVMKAIQDNHVIGDIKHYALNDQESGRNAVNVHIDRRSARESDLLAFEIALRKSSAGGVMCSYNRFNGDFACENDYLLRQVLKKDFQFKGFVLSDWGGTHSTVKASAAGLDNEEPADTFYGAAYKTAVQSGKIPMAELNEHVHRILRTEFAAGVVDDPPQRSVVDVLAGFEISQHLAEHSIVLLQNKSSILPLSAANLHSIAVIGAHSDIAMLSGGGSAQVDPPVGNAIDPPGKGGFEWLKHIWFPTSPLNALKSHAPNANFVYDPGTDPSAAAAAAKSADIAILFAHQWQSEDMDLDSLSLPEHQDAVIAAVAAANPHTIVVLETGSVVTMPWAGNVAGIVAAWYSGSRGADAVANILFGTVNPDAKLPLTFPLSESDLPHAAIVKPPPASTERFYGKDGARKNAEGLPAFETTYDEGLKVGYKWYDSEKKSVLFPFGFGLSYTTYAYSDLKVTPGPQVTVQFTIKNTGSRAGAEIAQVYAGLPAAANEPPKRLVAFSKIPLEPGESKQVTVSIEPEYLSVFDESADAWKLIPGAYTLRAGPSLQDLPLSATIQLN